MNAEVEQLNIELSVSEPIVEKIMVKKVAAKIVAKKVAKKVADKMDSEEAWMERVLKDFKEHPKAQSKKRKAKIANLVNKTADSPEVQAVIDRMVKAGKLKFDEKDVPEYSLCIGLR